MVRRPSARPVRGARHAGKRHRAGEGAEKMETGLEGGVDRETQILCGGICRRRSSDWIPAFAGMTEGGGSDGESRRPFIVSFTRGREERMATNFRTDVLAL